MSNRRVRLPTHHVRKFADNHTLAVRAKKPVGRGILTPTQIQTTIIFRFSLFNLYYEGLDFFYPIQIIVGVRIPRPTLTTCRFDAIEHKPLNTLKPIL